MQDSAWPVSCVLHLWEESVHTECPLNLQIINTTCLFHSEFTCAFFLSQAVRSDLACKDLSPRHESLFFVFLTLCTPKSSPLQARKILGRRSWGSSWMRQWIPMGLLLETPEGLLKCFNVAVSCLLTQTQLPETFNWGRQVLTWELQMTPSLAEWHYKLTCKFQSNSH